MYPRQRFLVRVVVTVRHICTGAVGCVGYSEKHREESESESESELESELLW